MIQVLVVDDDFMVARLHSSVVASQPGFEVIGAARTGADALAAVRTLRPDLVLLDIYLPDMSGLEVLRRFRESSSDYPVDVIVISAARDLDTLRTALRGGVFQYLVKPFEVESLSGRLRDYAGHQAELHDLTEAHQEEVDRVFRTQQRPDPTPKRHQPRNHRPRTPRPRRGTANRLVSHRMRRGDRPLPQQHPPLPGTPGHHRQSRNAPPLRSSRPPRTPLPPTNQVIRGPPPLTNLLSLVRGAPTHAWPEPVR